MNKYIDASEQNGNRFSTIIVISTIGSRVRFEYDYLKAALVYSSFENRISQIYAKTIYMV